jgi:hypothetical protein
MLNGVRRTKIGTETMQGESIQTETSEYETDLARVFQRVMTIETNLLKPIKTKLRIEEE